jgi:membrane protein implicated in regulation of membrane protease activity
VLGLYRLHRAVIGSAILLGLVFAAYTGLAWRATGSPLPLALAVLSLAASVALAAYLRWFVRSRATTAPSAREQGARRS